MFGKRKRKEIKSKVNCESYRSNCVHSGKYYIFVDTYCYRGNAILHTRIRAIIIFHNYVRIKFKFQIFIEHLANVYINQQEMHIIYLLHLFI